MAFKPRMKSRVPVDLDGKVKSGAGDWDIRVVELSDCGLLLWCVHPFTPEDQITAFVDLEGNGSTTRLDLVIRNSRSSDYPHPEDGYLAGAEFTDTNEDDVERIKKFLLKHRYDSFRRPKFR